MKGPAVKGSQQDLVSFLFGLQHLKVFVNHRERKSPERQETFGHGNTSSRPGHIAQMSFQISARVFLAGWN